jgi:hypothetical protein
MIDDRLRIGACKRDAAAAFNQQLSLVLPLMFIYTRPVRLELNPPFRVLNSGRFEGMLARCPHDNDHGRPGSPE